MPILTLKLFKLIFFLISKFSNLKRKEKKTLSFLKPTFTLNRQKNAHQAIPYLFGKKALYVK